MKAVILAGGLGTRISEESQLRPKPMIEIGGKPILWHIMKIISAYGINDFVICCGYKGYMIKEYFANYYLHTSDVTFDMRTDNLKVHQNSAEPWKVTLVDTGDDTMTGGRLKAVAPYLSRDAFLFTYGDGVGNVDLRRLIAHHRKSGKLATITTVQQPGHYGVVKMSGDRVTGFAEKPERSGNWISGGYFVLTPGIFKYIDGPDTIWEREPLQRLAAKGNLAAYRHAGFWYAMDSMRDKAHLEKLWQSGDAPWKVWK